MSRTKRLSVLGTILALAAAACGDDGATTGSTSTGTGGAGQGGATSTTGASGGSGGGLGALGAPCTSDDDCADGLCLTEATEGMPGGSCSRWCDPTAPSEGCPEGFCESSGTLGLVCFAACDPEAPTCRDAYRCRPSDFTATTWTCRATCDDDGDCPLTGQCVSSTVDGVVVSGSCEFPETACDDLRDDDHDGYLDCVDDDCAADASCVGGSSPLGGPCLETTDCVAGTVCASEAELRFPGGACVASAPGACPTGQARDAMYYGFVGDPNHGYMGFCEVSCTTSATCRPGYTCSSGGCRPHCTLDAQCTSGVCDEITGLCYFPEACDNGLDDDKSGAVDCADTACTASCANAFAAQCAAAVALPTQGDFATSVGQQSVCGGPGGALDFYTYTATVAGTLDVTVTTGTPHVVGIHDSCTMPSNPQCSTGLYAFSPTVEKSKHLGAGQTAYVSVGTAASLVGPYSIGYVFTPD